MKVTLASKKKDCTAYGLKFDSKGVCDAGKDSGVEALIASGVVVSATKPKSTK